MIEDRFFPEIHWLDFNAQQDKMWELASKTQRQLVVEAWQATLNIINNPNNSNFKKYLKTSSGIDREYIIHNYEGARYKIKLNINCCPLDKIEKMERGINLSLDF